jgi:hypothetical protein
MRVTLITRHKGDLKKSLEQFGIGTFFNQIIHITNDDPKSKFINSGVKFLFIDDSFRERFDVSTQFGEQVLVLDESFIVGRKFDESRGNF